MKDKTILRKIKEEGNNVNEHNKKEKQCHQK
jgi:hypothetical protein